MGGLGLLDRIVKSAVYDQSPQQIVEEERVAQEKLAMQAMMNDQMLAGPMGGYSGGMPVAPPHVTPLPPNIDRETLELYLKTKTPRNKKGLKGEDRFWIYDDEVTTAIITGNYTAPDVEKFKTIMRQARYLQGCDNVDRLVLNLQDELWDLVRLNKGRSDLPDHIRERIVPSVGIGLAGSYSAQTDKHSAERPRESRAIVGIFNRGGQ